MADESCGSYGEQLFFERVGPRLERLAVAHNLQLEKWVKDVAYWALRCKHPRGGTVQIAVGPSGDFPEDGADLSSCWWLDDYGSETRRIAWGDKRTAREEEPLLEDAVLEEVRRALGWTESNLKHHQLPKGIWHQWFSREAFEMLDESLPNPDL